MWYMKVLSHNNPLQQQQRVQLQKSSGTATKILFFHLARLRPFPWLNLTLIIFLKSMSCSSISSTRLSNMQDSQLWINSYWLITGIFSSKAKESAHMHQHHIKGMSIYQVFRSTNISKQKPVYKVYNSKRI